MWGADFYLFTINNLEMVNQMFASGNQVGKWLSLVETLRQSAGA